MRVDVHSHFLPPRYFEEVARLDGFKKVESLAFYGSMIRGVAEQQFAAGEQSFIDGWIDQLDACSFDTTILSIGAVQPYFPDDPVAGATATRFANVMMRDAVELSGDRFAAFASLPLPHVAASLDEIAFAYDECGSVGVNLGSSAGGRPLDHPMFDDIWAALDERHASVFVHPGTCPLMVVGSEDHFLAPHFCSPAEVAVALCRLVTSKLLDRYPNVTIIAADMGGSLPYLAWRYDAGLKEFNPALYEEIGGVVPQLRRFWFDTMMNEHPGLLDPIRDSVGVDRLVCGSDLPHYPLRKGFDFIMSLESLSEEEKSKILDENGVLAVPALLSRTTAGSGPSC